MGQVQTSAGKLGSARLGLMQLVGQCFCIGPLIDIALARQHLGWEPTVPLEEGIERTIAYFRTEV